MYPKNDSFSQRITVPCTDYSNISQNLIFKFCILNLQFHNKIDRISQLDKSFNCRCTVPIHTIHFFHHPTSTPTQINGYDLWTINNFKRRIELSLQVMDMHNTHYNWLASLLEMASQLHIALSILSQSISNVVRIKTIAYTMF